MLTTGRILRSLRSGIDYRLCRPMGIVNLPGRLDLRTANMGSSGEEQNSPRHQQAFLHERHLNVTVSEFYFLTVRKCTMGFKMFADDLHARSRKAKLEACQPVYGRSSCQCSQGAMASSSRKY